MVAQDLRQDQAVQVSDTLHAWAAYAVTPGIRFSFGCSCLSGLWLTLNPRSSPPVTAYLNGDSFNEQRVRVIRTNAPPFLRMGDRQVMVFRASADFHAWSLHNAAICHSGHYHRTLLLYADFSVIGKHSGGFILQRCPSPRCRSVALQEHRLSLVQHDHSTGRRNTQGAYTFTFMPGVVYR